MFLHGPLNCDFFFPPESLHFGSFLDWLEFSIQILKEELRSVRIFKFLRMLNWPYIQRYLGEDHCYDLYLDVPSEPQELIHRDFEK